jgi:aminoglycoside 3-N-acetyltransferase
MELDAEFVARRQPIVRSRLVDELQALGLGRDVGAVVMVHCRMSALGWVVGGAETVVSALLGAVGPRGTLLAYTSWQDAPPYDLSAWPSRWQDAYLAEHPAFDPARAEADRSNGRVAEKLRTWPGAVRSRHPDVSFAAVGPRGRWLVADHPLDDPHGPGSPLARLVEADGQVLLLAAPLATMTLLHHAEAIARVPGKRRVTYRMPILVERETVWRTFHDIDTDHGAFPYEQVVDPDKDPFAVIVEQMLAAGIATSRRVGDGTAYLFDARAALDFGVAWMEDRFTPDGNDDPDRPSGSALPRPPARPSS